MAEVTVFVDDAVRGDLPPICARTGFPTEGMTALSRPVSGTGGGVWILVLLGPIGWIILALMLAFSMGRELLTILVPEAPEVDEMDRPLKQRRLAAGLLALASPLFSPLVDWPGWGCHRSGGCSGVRYRLPEASVPLDRGGARCLPALGHAHERTSGFRSGRSRV